MTSHDASTIGTSRVITVASLQRLKIEALIPAPANTQSRAQIEIHRQLWQQSFPTDFPLLVPQNCREAPPVLKIERQVGAKTTYTRSQIKAHGVSIDNCGLSSLIHQEIPVRSAFSEWQRGEDECHSGSKPICQTSTIHGYKSWSHGMTNISIPEVNILKNSSILVAECLLQLNNACYDETSVAS